MNRSQLLRRVHTAWEALEQSFAALSEARLTEPGVSGEWSVKDILAHVTTWEAEALKYLPLIVEGGTPPRYASEGGIDVFNARMADHKRALSLADVLGQLRETHRRLIDYIEGVCLRPSSRARRAFVAGYGSIPTATMRNTPGR